MATTHYFQKGDPEPPRNKVLVDTDGDSWEWDSARQHWVCRTSSGEYVCKLTWANIDEWCRLPWSYREDGFVVKDSGVREEYANGFVRDTEDGKSDLTAALALLYERPDLAKLITRPGFDLLPREALERWADHMAKGAEKYGADNWRQARGPIAVARFLRSLVRHVAQYLTGDRSEDHAAAVCFNVWAAELTPGDEEERDDG